MDVFIVVGWIGVCLLVLVAGIDELARRSKR